MCLIHGQITIMKCPNYCNIWLGLILYFAKF